MSISTSNTIGKLIGSGTPTSATPTTPSTLTINAGTILDTTVELVWSGKGQAVEQSTDGGTTWTASTTTGITDTGTTVTGLTAGLAYSFRVTISVSGTVDVLMPPAAPTGVTVTAKFLADLDVTFTSGTGATSHLIQYKTGAGAYSTPITVTGTSHTITGLTEGTTYEVKVTAKNASGEKSITGSQTTKNLTAKLADTENLGSASNRGTVLNTQTTARNLIDVINTYLVSNIDTTEFNYILANLGTRYKFEIGYGDRRSGNSGLTARFSVATNWNGTGANAETSNLLLSPEAFTAGPYNHRITFNKSAKTIKVTDNHAGQNSYGSIRYFKVVRV